ncbi:MAG: polyhydroxyalkanoate synthesis regulator DNA-binding domain-containing protein, partial [Pseudomonadota bacterium]
LDDIVKLINSGIYFVVEDTKTGQDLTRSILNQIIYERETAQSDYHFPLDVQKQLILMYDDAYGKMVPDYLSESMKLFVAERDKIKNAFEEMVTHNSKAMAEYSERLALQNLDMFNRSFEFFRTMSGIGADQDETQTEKAVPLSKDEKADALKDIQKQIDALQKQLKSIE